MKKLGWCRTWGVPDQEVNESERDAYEEGDLPMIHTKQRRRVCRKRSDWRQELFVNRHIPLERIYQAV